MRLVFRALAAGGAAVVTVALLSAPAQAQATRTWVSGVGDDVNPCSRTAPCKTFAGAISKTATGGTINALDSGGFGSVTITKSITIDGGGYIASTLANGTVGISINAADDSDVVLRDMDITGVDNDPASCTSTDGVQIRNARSVRLDHVSISGFKRAINTPLTNSSADIYVDMSFNDLDIYNNCEHGLRIAPDAGHHARTTIEGVVISGSNVALSVAAGAEAWVSNSKFYLNNLGVESVGGPIHSLCNNSVAGNASPGAFTDQSSCTVPTGPPPAPPAAPAVRYCSVPTLTGKSVGQARTALTKAGCKLGKVSKQKAVKKKRKKVVTQAIPATVQVRLGTAVAIKIGK